ncbi:MAG: ParB N-terminal domain-containing protein [Dehalococcoidia bacterium]|nr:ParB N-terminal domain-containing protein [Dehalococcoidia bacterium]
MRASKSTKSKPTPTTTETATGPIVHEPVTLRVDDLKEHPKNYRNHPADQLAHIVESIKANGFYRNVVVAQDNTILAGHGSVKAARLAGLARIPVVRLKLDANDPRAMKILIGDNEIPRLAEVDDRVLTDLLKSIDVSLDGLLGTGFDSNMLASLVYNTRPGSEVKDINDAAEWTGMPEYEQSAAYRHLIRLTITFETEAVREEFIKSHGLIISQKMGGIICAPWPPRGRDDVVGVRFEPAGDDDEA